MKGEETALWNLGTFFAIAPSLSQPVLGSSNVLEEVLKTSGLPGHLNSVLVDFL